MGVGCPLLLAPPKGCAADGSLEPQGTAQCSLGWGWDQRLQRKVTRWEEGGREGLGTRVGAQRPGELGEGGEMQGPVRKKPGEDR